jgi:hypothetical protein
MVSSQSRNGQREAGWALGALGLRRAQPARTNALRSPVSNRVSDTTRRSLGQAAAACLDESGFIRT